MLSRVRPGSPILISDGVFENQKVSAVLAEQSAEIDRDTVGKVMEMLDLYGGNEC